LVNRAMSFALYASVNAFGGLLFGYNMGIIANAQDELIKQFNLGNLELGLLASSLLLGATIGSVAGGILTDLIGRKKATIITALVSIVGAISTALAPTFISLCILRIVLGFGVGLSSVGCPLYVSEMAPRERRGVLGTLFQLFITFGFLVAYAIGFAITSSSIHYTMQWRLMFAIAVAPPVCLLVVAIFFMAESEIWLQMKQSQSQKGSNKTVEFETPLTPLLINESGSAGSGWSELFSRRQLKPLLLGIVLAINLSLTGINAVLFFAVKIFQIAGFHNETLMTLLVGLWNFLVTCFAMTLVDKFGRKKLLLAGLSLVVLGDIVLGFAFNSMHGSVKGYTATVSLFMFVGGFAVGPGAVFWVLVGELFSKEVRGQAGGFVNLLQWGFNLVVATVFRTMLSAIGPAITFWLFGGVGLFCFIYLLLLLPETKGKEIN